MPEVYAGRGQWTSDLFSLNMSTQFTFPAMASRLPPMQALRAFEAAARERSLTRAAAALHLTHGAISHQIKSLESDLGV